MNSFLLNFLFLCLSTIISIRLNLVRSESVEEEQGDPYYGVPLGALHYSAEGTSAEVYAADEFSIIFNHFYHNPREQGCTGMMIGPPRTEDKDNVVAGHGVLLAMAHPPAAARHKHRRAKRGAGGGKGRAQKQQQFRGYWPAEFDHLLMRPEEPEGNKPEGNIRGKVGKTEGQQKGKTGTRGEQQQLVVNKVNLSNTSVTDQLIHGASWALDSSSLPSPNVSSSSSPSSPSNSSSSSSAPSSSSTTTSPSQSASTLLANISSSSSPSTSPSSSQLPSSSLPSSSSSSTNSPPSSSSTVSPINPPPSLPPHPSRPTPPILLLSNKKSREGHQQIHFTTEKAPTMQMGRISGKRAGGEIRRSPVRHNPPELGMEEWVKANELDEKGIPPTVRTTPRTTPQGAATTTPLFWVIKDPREARRERLLQLRRKMDPDMELPTTSTTAAPFSPVEAQFELPRIRDKLATFSLTNGAKITQYKWIGLWNQCTKRHIPLVSLRDVDPPREEKIMPLSGWSHNVTSYRLHILNCNTILIPSFHYDARNATRNTYFFVGVGQFPEAVEQQVKANIVGTRPGEPLRSYLGEDVLLRLPRPYRTFDIDFISIFNVDEQKSFGHVIIPSLLVPPCPDDE